MRVLLVDDSRNMRIIQRRILNGLNIHAVVEANSGMEALQQMEKYDYSFDFVISDLNMPDLSGTELLKRIRSHPKSKSLPVIICTSIAEKENILAAVLAGANAYLVKPFDPVMMENKIRQLLKLEAA